MICLQCQKPTIKMEIYKDQEVSMCAEGHRTGFMAGLTEEEKQSVIADMFIRGITDQAI